MKYLQWHMKPGSILLLTPLKVSLQWNYCNKHLYHLLLSCMMRSQSGEGKKSDSAIAITMRGNTGADILIDNYYLS